MKWLAILLLARTVLSNDNNPDGKLAYSSVNLQLMRKNLSQYLFNHDSVHYFCNRAALAFFTSKYIFIGSHNYSWQKRIFRLIVSTIDFDVPTQFVNYLKLLISCFVFTFEKESVSILIVYTSQPDQVI